MKISVVFTIDESYIQHFCTALTSLLENNTDNIDQVFLIVDKSFDTSLLSTTFDYIFKEYHIAIKLKKINESLFNTFKIDHHITLASYYRIFLADILPLDISKVLFLDSDIIVNGNISEILNYNFKNPNSPDEFFVYAADHLNSLTQIQRLRPLGFTHDVYFNAGILWINLDLWRFQKISKKAIEFINKNNEFLQCHDQDVLNVLFDGNFGLLDAKFNVFEEALKVVKDPIIIHYTGSLKPWHYLSKHTYKHKYFYYLQFTQFHSFKYKDKNLKHFIEKHLPERIRKVLKPWYHKISNL